MSKVDIREVSPGRWACTVQGFAPLPIITAPTRDAALQQIRTRLGDTARMAAALGVGIGGPKAATAGPSTPKPMTMAQIRRIQADADKLLASSTACTATPAPRAVDPRIAKSFGLQTSAAGVRHEAHRSVFGVRK